MPFRHIELMTIGELFLDQVLHPAEEDDPVYRSGLLDGIGRAMGSLMDPTEPFRIGEFVFHFVEKDGFPGFDVECIADDEDDGEPEEAISN